MPTPVRTLAFFLPLLLSGPLCGNAVSAEQPPETPTPPAPGEWELVFEDTFEADGLDTEKWTHRSSSQRDHQQGNRGHNDQLEWNQPANAEVRGGRLILTARRENHTSPSGHEYEWTSALLTTSPSFAFTYGYIEERAKLPTEPGFWPAFWTWQQPGGQTQQEIDVYEFWSGWNADRFLATTHPWGGGKWIYYSEHNTSPGEWNVYGADIRPDGVTFYLNGEAVHETPNAPTEPMNLITNLAVDANNPPANNEAAKEVDHVRAWKRTDALMPARPTP